MKTLASPILCNRVVSASFLKVPVPPFMIKLPELAPGSGKVSDSAFSRKKFLGKVWHPLNRDSGKKSSDCLVSQSDPAEHDWQSSSRDFLCRL